MSRLPKSWVFPVRLFVVCETVPDCSTSSCRQLGVADQHNPICDRARVLPLQVGLTVFIEADCRIQSIINGTSFEGKLDLNQLDKAIQTAINASKDVDKQAERAVERLRKLLPKHPHFSLSQKVSRFFTRFGGCHGQSDKMELWSDETHSTRFHPSVPLPNLGHVKEIKKVLEEIRVINKKKQGFEGGFISEEGIKVRLIHGLLTVSDHRTASGTSIREWRQVHGWDTELRL